MADRLDAAVCDDWDAKPPGILRYLNRLGFRIFFGKGIGE
jgi:hypothetical protein